MTGDKNLERFYRSLYRIRRTEEEIVKIYPTDKIQSPIHLSIGQEAVSVGVCEALKPRDAVFGTYRSHALYLAKGGNLKKMFSELYGKKTGSAKGKSGSMHLADAAAGVLGTSAVVGTSIPNAVGYAYALMLKKKPNIAVSFFGDGAVDEGVFHESLNFAALKKIPIIFVCENNFYAIHSHQRMRQAIPDITARAASYGIPAKRISGNDIFALYREVQRVRSSLLRGGGPRFFECATYRWKEHVGPGDDFGAGYRSRNETKPWIENDPLGIIGRRLPKKMREDIERTVEKEIKEAIQFAEKSSFPKPEELYKYLFA